MDGYYKPGDNYFLCPACGFKKRVSDGRYQWDKEFVCTNCWNPKHPQESVRAIVDLMAVRISRPEPMDIFIDVGDVTPGDL